MMKEVPLPLCVHVKDFGISDHICMHAVSTNLRNGMIKIAYVVYDYIIVNCLATN